jgi:sugar phosphate isomerase/epimerase
MLGISTCWWHERTDQGAEIAAEILDLGFDGVELEYRMTEAIFRQMQPYLDRSLTVLSIHNFFPFPALPGVRKGSGDLFLLSSKQEDERSRAVAHTIRTMDHARQVGAKALVLHLGRVEIPGHAAMASQRRPGGGRLNRAQEAVTKSGRQRRKALRQGHLDAVFASLETLLPEAERRGIRLGLENRYYFYEIPDFEEIGMVLGRFRSKNIGYWHDVGHAQVQEYKGIARQRELLEAYGDDLIGVHLHDALGLDDHLAPGQGDVDFGELRLFLKPTHIKILEVHPKVPKRNLIEGIRFVRALGLDEDPRPHKR